MEFVNPDIQKEFERLTELYPDLEDIKHPLINMSDTLRAYFALADFFTDNTSEKQETMLVGLRSADLLYSALGRQTVSFGPSKKYTNSIDICSTLFYGMVKNHSFSDGNKRTALLTLLYQLNLYGYYPNCALRQFERLVVAVAANNLSISFKKEWEKCDNAEDQEIRTISLLLKNMTKKKDHSYHLKITMRDLSQALSKYDVEYSLGNGKIHFQRKTPKKFFRQSLTFKHSMVFGGWTRSVGAQSMRDLLSKLELYEQFPNYQAFIDGQEPYYSLIQDFEGPLRRLKDE